VRPAGVGSDHGTDDGAAVYPGNCPLFLVKASEGGGTILRVNLAEVPV
jgi:hypothetical protein